MNFDRDLFSLELDVVPFDLAWFLYHVNVFVLKKKDSFSKTRDQMFCISRRSRISTWPDFTVASIFIILHLWTIIVCGTAVVLAIVTV